MSKLGQFGPAVRIMILFTLVLGLAYPLVVTGIGQVVFPRQADGSFVKHDGTTVGSSLIGQSFTGKGVDEAQWFQSRPSAAGDGYDPLASGASNLGLDNPALVKLVTERRAAVAKLNGVPESAVPADAVLASASGLDPHISPAYAAIQVARIARERDLSVSAVRALVEKNTRGRTLGILGEPRVNVLTLNVALDGLTNDGLTNDGLTNDGLTNDGAAD